MKVPGLEFTLLLMIIENNYGSLIMAIRRCFVLFSTDIVYTVNNALVDIMTVNVMSKQNTFPFIHVNAN